MGPDDGDLLAIPDPSTLTPLPWRPEVGWLSCDLVLNGVDLDHGPRNVLRTVVGELATEGAAEPPPVSSCTTAVSASTPSRGGAGDVETVA